MGEGDDVGGDRAPFRLVGVEAALAGTVAEDVGEPGGQRDRVLYAGVHALAACGTVHVRGVSGEEYPALPVAVGEPVVDAKPRAPHDVLHLRGPLLRAARVQQRLDVLAVGVLGRLVDRGDDPVTAAW